MRKRHSGSSSQEGGKIGSYPVLGWGCAHCVHGYPRKAAGVERNFFSWLFTQQSLLILWRDPNCFTHELHKTQ